MRTREKSLWAMAALVVLVAGVVVPTWPDASPKTPVQLALEEMERIADVFRTSEREHGGWPGPGNEIRGNSAMICAFLGGYSRLLQEGSLTEEDVIDPWGRGYQVYRFPSSIILVSPGPDGVLDTSLQDIACAHPSSDDLVHVIHGP